MKKIVILSLLAALSTVSVYAQNKGKTTFNRYGCALVQKDGKWQMNAWEAYSQKFGLKDTADFFTPYHYVPIAIHPEDFEGCTTRTLVYKKYPGYELKIEMDTPKEGKGPFPYMVYIHGGAFRIGSPAAFEDHSKYLATKIGVAGLRISYSLIPQGADYQMCERDVKDAIDYIRSHAKELNLDNRHWGIAGGSAGAILGGRAAMIYTDCTVFAGYNGHYDMFNFLKDTNASEIDDAQTKSSFYGITPANAKEANTKYSAIANMRANPPATITFHGSADATIDCSESLALVRAVRDKGVPAEAFTFEYSPHAFFHKGKSDRYEPCILLLCDFVKAHI